MNNTFEFQGPLTNLGRFGLVKKGDVLLLTDHEAACIKDDKRFKQVAAKVPDADKKKVEQLSVSEMNHDQLVEYCEAIRKVDPTFQFRRDSEHAVLLASVRQRMDQQTKNPA